MAEWYFRPKLPGEPNRESVHGEFFATDAISDPGMSLVREGIQNALDASRDGEEVLVRIALSVGENAASAADVAPFFDTAWQHLRTRGNGLRTDDLPGDGSPCPFLVFEDFGTTGLQGDPGQAFEPRGGAKNHFYHFFRAEGQSDKDIADRGSWGVGKHVFLRASRINTVFGLTVRTDDRQRLLMGKAFLRSHYVGEAYFQDGYFGIRQSLSDQLVLPEEDDGILDRFARIFDLHRGHEAGLSVVVPWPDPEVDKRAIVLALLHDYFFPILAGQLTVVVEVPGVETMLDAATLAEEVGRLDEDAAGDLRPLIELAAWARDLPDTERAVLAMPDPDRAWKWSEALFSDEQLQALRDGLQQGERLAIRVPVTVRKRDGSSQESFFDAYLLADTGDRGSRPVFIREGIIISRVGAPRSRSVRAIVVAQDVPLAAFLRAAENPSHTEWQHVRLKHEYKFGYKTDLDFVRRSVHEIVRILRAAENAEDPRLLADFFSLPAPPEDAEQPRTRRRRSGPENGDTTTPPELPPPRPARFPFRRSKAASRCCPAVHQPRKGAPLGRRYARRLCMS